MITLHTNFGDIVVELNTEKAAATAENFKKYAEDGFYNGTIFHRVEKEFVVQGGGYNENLEERDRVAPIFNESGNGLKNRAFTIAMARQKEPHSAMRQFYFNMADNEGLDPGKTWGYAVFGYVSSGEEVLELIANTQVHTEPKYQWENVPIRPIFLTKATLLNPTE